MKHKIKESPAQRIEHLRRLILIHSIIYYELNDNIVSDAQWSAWGIELEKLQEQYPELSDTLIYADAFKNFDHSTGSNLPLDDPWANHKARQLLKWRDFDLTGSAY